MPPKNSKVQKAKKAQKAHKKGVNKYKRKLRHTVHFRCKPTLKELRDPKYAKKVSLCNFIYIIIITTIIIIIYLVSKKKIQAKNQ